MLFKRAFRLSLVLQKMTFDSKGLQALAWSCYLVVLWTCPSFLGVFPWGFLLLCKGMFCIFFVFVLYFYLMVLLPVYP